MRELFGDFDARGVGLHLTDNLSREELHDRVRQPGLEAEGAEGYASLPKRMPVLEGDAFKSMKMGVWRRGVSFDCGTRIVHPTLVGWMYNPLPSLRTNGG